MWQAFVDKRSIVYFFSRSVYLALFTLPLYFAQYEQIIFFLLPQHEHKTTTSTICCGDHTAKSALFVLYYLGKRLKENCNLHFRANFQFRPCCSEHTFFNFHKMMTTKKEYFRDQLTALLAGSAQRYVFCMRNLLIKYWNFVFVYDGDLINSVASRNQLNSTYTKSNTKREKLQTRTRRRRRRHIHFTHLHLHC